MTTETETTTRPYLITWRDVLHPIVIHADQVDLPDREDRTLTLWCDDEIALTTDMSNIHHVRLLSTDEATNLAEDARLKAAAEQALREAIQAHIDRRGGCGDQVGTTEDEPETPEQPQAEPCVICNAVTNNGVTVHGDYCPNKPEHVE